LLGDREAIIGLGLELPQSGFVALQPANENRASSTAKDNTDLWESMEILGMENSFVIRSNPAAAKKFRYFFGGTSDGIQMSQDRQDARRIAILGSYLWPDESSEPMKIILAFFAIVAGILFFCIATSAIERLRHYRSERLTRQANNEKLRY
jgi:hypothetical protein